MDKVTEVMNRLAFILAALLALYWLVDINAHLTSRTDTERIGLAIFWTLNGLILEVIYWRTLWERRKQS